MSQQDEATTRDRIVEASLSLFNTRGFDGTSVARICQKAGIMPGNLTYYFPKKKDLILELERRFESEIISLQSQTFIDSKRDDVTAESTALLIIRILKIIWRYRFFYTSIMSLQNLDPQIRTKFRYIEQRAQAGTANLVQRAIDLGKMRSPRYPNSVPTYAENLWYVSWSSIFFHQLRSADKNPSEMEVIHSCAMHCAAFIEPYITDELSAELCEAVNRHCMA